MPAAEGIGSSTDASASSSAVNSATSTLASAAALPAKWSSRALRELHALIAEHINQPTAEKPRGVSTTERVSAADSAVHSLGSPQHCTYGSAISPSAVAPLGSNLAITGLHDSPAAAPCLSALDVVAPPALHTRRAHTAALRTHHTHGHSHTALESLHDATQDAPTAAALTSSASVPVAEVASEPVSGAGVMASGAWRAFNTDANGFRARISPCSAVMPVQELLHLAKYRLAGDDDGKVEE